MRPKSRLGRRRTQDTKSHDNYHVSHDISQLTERRPSTEIQRISLSSVDEPDSLVDPLEDMQRPTTSRGGRASSFDLGPTKPMTPPNPNCEQARPQTGRSRDSASNLGYANTPCTLSSSSLTPSPPPLQHARPKSGMGRQRRRRNTHDAGNITESTIGHHHHHWTAAVGRRPQHAASKLGCLAQSSARSCRSSICPGRPFATRLVSHVVILFPSMLRARLRAWAVFNCLILGLWVRVKVLGSDYNNRFPNTKRTFNHNSNDNLTLNPK